MKEDKKLYDNGLSEFNKGHYEEALKIYEKIKPGSEVYSDAQNDIGLCYTELKQYKKAEAYYLEAAKIESENWVPLSNNALNLAYRRKYKEAAIYFEKAISLEPKAHVYFNAAYNYELINDEKAISRYQTCINKFPDYSDAYFNLANLYSKLKQYNEANKLFLKLIELDPTYPDVYINLGVNLSYMEKYQESISYFDQAIRINPKDPSPYILKGLSLHDLEEYDKAIECFNKAIKLEPKNPDHYEVRGDSYYNWDKDDLALNDYQEALELGSKSKRIIKRIKELEEIIKGSS